jgi:hypothetical protein
MKLVAKALLVIFGVLNKSGATGLGNLFADIFR